MTDGTDLWLDLIPLNLRDKARESLKDGDWEGFFICASNTDFLFLLFKNVQAFKNLSIYEPALLHALTITRTNNSECPTSSLRTMIAIADLSRLRAAGDPLLSPGPFTVYRGVAGRGRQRRVYGLSWTSSVHVAAWFAHRSGLLLPDPSVFQLTVDERQVLAYNNSREEQEFLVSHDTYSAHRARRCLDGPELERLADQHAQKIGEAFQKAISDADQQVVNKARSDELRARYYNKWQNADEQASPTLPEAHDSSKVRNIKKRRR